MTTEDTANRVSHREYRERDVAENGRSGRKGISQKIAALFLCVFGVLCAFSPLLNATVLPNPEFRDEDGDGVPDGWKLETFILENFRGVNCLSMRFERHSDAPLKGSASTVFNGPEGFYRVTIEYLDESDGVSKGKFLVNDEILRIWDFDNTFRDYWREEVLENVALKPGDKIAFWGQDNPSEYCRVRAIRIEPTPTPPSAIELEERNNPPQVENREFGPLVALRDARDVSAMARWPEYQPLIATRSPVLLLKKSGEEADVELTMNKPHSLEYSVRQHEVSTSAKTLGDGAQGDVLLEGELPFDVAAPLTTIPLPEEAGGMLELRLPQGRIQSDSPHVLLTQTAAAEQRRGGASGAFYFFVPKGTTAFGVGAYSSGRTVEVTLYAPDRSLVTKMDVKATDTLGLPVRVKPGQDDGIWTLIVSGVSPTIRLVGVPPYLATHPSLLLVPKESVEAKP